MGQEFPDFRSDILDGCKNFWLFEKSDCSYFVKLSRISLTEEHSLMIKGKAIGTGWEESQHR